jgi:hypothetical protein
MEFANSDNYEGEWYIKSFINAGFTTKNTEKESIYLAMDQYMKEIFIWTL